MAGPDNTRKGIIYLLALVAISALLLHLGLTVRQAIASALVLALVLGTVLFWEIRLSFALVGVSVLLASGLLSTEKFIEFSALDIIAFLAGMMILVGYLEKNAFFEFLVSKLLVLIGGGGKRIVFMIMILSAVFAALVDEVTSILFMLSIVLHLTAKLRVNPVPFVIMTVFATNIGSSATAVGNPVGVMIALNAGLSFSDFLAHASPVSAVALLVGMAVSYLCFRREIEEFAARARKTSLSELVDVHQAGKSTMLSAGIFFGVLALLILHAQIEHALGLEKNAMLLGTALGAAGLILVLEAGNARHFVETKVDWWTLFFFMMLFASVGALEESGVMSLASGWFLQEFGGSRIAAMVGIMGISGLLSAMLDNVLAVAVFVPLVKELMATAVGGDHLWWSLLFGSTFFGNLTLIGSTANIVALGLIEKRGFPRISFLQWISAGSLVVAATAATAIIMLYLQYGG